MTLLGFAPLRLARRKSVAGPQGAQVLARQCMLASSDMIPSLHAGSGFRGPAVLSILVQTADFLLVRFGPLVKEMQRVLGTGTRQITNLESPVINGLRIDSNHLSERR